MDILTIYFNTTLYFTLYTIYTGETKILAKQALNKGPHNIQEFKFCAADEGMMVYDLYE